MEVTREALHRMVDELPDTVLRAARRALEALTPERSHDRQERLDRWMVQTGRMARIPRREHAMTTRPISRLRIAGSPVSETLLEERR
jgi:actin-like ATPase involved in cell morphogenesis